MDSNHHDSKGRSVPDVRLVELGSGSGSDESRENDPSRPENGPTAGSPDLDNQPQFRLYKRRHAGVLGIIVLNIVGGMNLTWFGPIANSTSEAFGITLDQVNWLGNIAACTYIVVAPLVPLICSRYGIRKSYAIGTGFLILSAWVRFAGTAKSLDSRSAYALLIIGQFLAAIPQVVFQVLAPKFSETWFDQNGRTTATMLMSVSNPVGTALGQLISPMIDSVRASILVLGIISTAVAPFSLLVGAKPPTPPSYSGSQPSHHFFTTLRAIFGLLPTPPPYTPNTYGVEYAFTSAPAIPESGRTFDNPVSKSSKEESADRDRVVRLGAAYPPESNTQRSGAAQQEIDPDAKTVVNVDVDLDAYMTLRERVDFVILTAVFSVLVAGVNTFSILSNEILEPYGYSEDTAGLMGAALLLSGLVAAFATAPLFDRVLTHHLGLSTRVAVPFIAAAWISLIFAARPNNANALFVVFAVIGVFSITMLPVALELGCELTRNSDASSAILWCSANIASIVFVLVMSALRASSTASPPLSMHLSLIYNGVSIGGASVFIFLFRGDQSRREKDARVAAAANAAQLRRTNGRNGEKKEGESEARKVRWKILLRIFRKGTDGRSRTVQDVSAN